MASSWEYPKELVRGLNNLREQNQLCDVIISVGGKSFHAHKTVLAATGDYFLEMFTSGFRESSENMIKIDGSAAAFEILLNFAYTGEVDSQVSTCIYEVLEMACYMQFTRFAQTCSSVVEDVLLENTYKLSVSDVWKVMLLAGKHTYMKQLHEVSLHYLEDHVEGLKCLDTFLENTSMTFLQAFLSRENLANEDDEKQVLELVINWLKHDWENRKKHSHQLLQKVRLGLVASEDIKELVSAEILGIPECLELVNQVLQVQASKKPRDVLATKNPDIAATRSTITAPIVSHGGRFTFYAVEHKDWIDLEKFDPLPSKTAKYSMVVADGILYAVGGKTGKEFYSYQARDNKWLQLPSISQCQKKTTLVSLGRYIYAIGMIRSPRLFVEFEGPGIMMERYDINEKKWEVMKPPPNNYKQDLFRFMTPQNGPRKLSDYMRSVPINDPLGMIQGISAVVFEGKIFVSSARRMRGRFLYENVYYTFEELIVYEPDSENWQINEIARRELDEEWEDAYVVEPHLFVYQDQLYRIFDQNDKISDHVMHVSLVILRSKDDGTTEVKVGKNLSQANLPAGSKEGTSAFCIGDNIFVTDSGVVCIHDGQDLEPGNLCPFPKFPTYSLSSNPVWFTFDRKKLSIEYYTLLLY
ncbi:kelch-like protein 15 [Amphiura filiformis]|uniref:kelch-like protein 15 n=1 Tax=Amphiura filiformis TaxID=82378 RepID=UPI003B2212F0